MVMELSSIKERDSAFMVGLLYVILLCVYVCDGTCACWYMYVVLLCFVMLCIFDVCMYVCF